MSNPFFDASLPEKPEDRVDEDWELCPPLSEQLLGFIERQVGERSISPSGLSAHEWHFELGHQQGRESLLALLRRVRADQMERDADFRKMQ